MVATKAAAIIDIRTIYRDMPLIAEQLGLSEDSIQYNSLLLSRYFIHDPDEKQLRGVQIHPQQKN